MDAVKGNGSAIYGEHIMRRYVSAFVRARSRHDDEPPEFPVFDMMRPERNAHVVDVPFVVNHDDGATGTEGE